MISKFEDFSKIIADNWFSQIRYKDSGSDMLKIVRHPQGPMTELEFKWHLADAILNKRFSIEDYERLTDFDFETRDEVADDLMQLWRLMFDDEAVALPIEQS
jgi:hypothetical protein